ncbi:hypothetical protein GGR53DRAFT_491448 [Hypoxylon sp. FL1150]|nr:hypothetical protein GGR53DRAFT_491448 [Hypoxylon sp. FL1150]
MIAFWLRSSVVSVLFSLISGRVLLELNLRLILFLRRGCASSVMHNRVLGITLLPSDAKFSCLSSVTISGLSRVAWRG